MAFLAPSTSSGIEGGGGGEGMARAECPVTLNSESLRQEMEGEVCDHWMSRTSRQDLNSVSDIGTAAFASIIHTRMILSPSYNQYLDTTVQVRNLHFSRSRLT